MERREVLLRLGTVVVSIPFAGWLIGCGIDDPDVATEVTPTPDGGSATRLVFTSSVAEGHAHEVSFDTALVSQPPSSGLESDTTLVQGHTHHIVLTEQDLRAMQGGNAVSRSTSFDQGHAHNFAFRIVST